MVKKFLEDQRLYAGVLVGWLSYYSVIFLLSPGGGRHDLTSLLPHGRLKSDMLLEAREEYLRQIISQHQRNQAIMMPLNAEVAVLPRPASTNNLNNATAFNARIEALGDLFMDEMFIQSNLDVEEVSRLLNAGFVSKEDLDFQRLVDVLWSQDVDLGVGRESFEYPLRGVTTVQSPADDKAYKEKLGVFSETAIPDGRNADRDNYYIDEETGELLPKNVPQLPRTSTITKNDLSVALKRDVCKENEASFECFEYLSRPYQAERSTTLPSALEGLPATNGSEVEAQQLQSLINALDSLNSSTLQAVINQGFTPDNKLLEDQWRDVEDVIASSSTTADIPVLDGTNANQDVDSAGQDNVQSGNSLADFDLFRVLMDPPVNYTLSSATLPPAPYNGVDMDDYVAGSSFVNGPSTSQSAINVTATSNDYTSLANQENLGQLYPMSSGSLVGPSMASLPLANYTNMLEWNLSDWRMNNFSVVAPMDPRTGMFNPPTNDWFTTEQALVVPTDVEVKMEAMPGNVEIVQNGQMKHEEGNNGWEEHVSHNHTYATTAPPPPLPPSTRRRGQSIQSREGSEEDQQSVSGSSGYDPLSFTEGRLGGRSRISRDERVALEAGLPLSALEIIRMPVEEFNGYINGQIGHLGTDQIQMMKDIRRRGKNKVAAQNCRKRKIDNVSHLEREIMGIREELKREAERRDDLLRLRDFHRAALAGSSAAVIPPIASTTSSLPAKQHATKPIRKRKRPDE